MPRKTTNDCSKRIGIKVTGTYLVFVDVDETLIRHKSMVAFMDHILQYPGSLQPEHTARLRSEYLALKVMHTAAADRSELNQRYYELFRGISRREVQAVAEQWCFGAMKRGDLFVETTYREVMAHRDRGAEIVLVSGSFCEVLRPIAAQVRATEIICTQLEVVGGVYTGGLLHQVIGDGKWAAMCRYLKGRESVNLQDCYAYGDHFTDVSFMERVGHPVAVGESPPMLDIAARRNWRVLSATQRVA